MSATQVIVGLGGIVYPILIEKFMTLYGYRGESQKLYFIDPVNDRFRKWPRRFTNRNEILMGQIH